MKSAIVDIVKDSHYVDIDYRYELSPFPVEVFVPMKEFPNYEISSYGRILFLGKSWHTGRNVIKKGKKIKIPGISKGYYCTTIFKNKKGSCVRPHRLVAEHFLSEPQKETVNHKDGNKLNNCYKNLEWATVQENIAHSVANNLWNHRGEAQTNSILKEEDIRVIRTLATKGISKRFIAIQFGVARETVQSIITRRTWKHVY